MDGFPRRLALVLRVAVRRLALQGALILGSLGVLSLAVDGGPLGQRIGAIAAFLGDVARLDLGLARTLRPGWATVANYPIVLDSPAVSAQIATRLVPWFWLLGETVVVTLLIAGPLGLAVAWRAGPGRLPRHTAVGHAIRLVPVFFLADLLVVLLAYSRRLFNIDWDTLVVDSPPVLTGLANFPDLATVQGLLIATKWALVPAVAASTAVVPTVTRAVRAAATQVRGSATASAASTRGTPELTGGRRAIVVWLLEGLPATVMVLQTAALAAETAAGNLEGLSRLLGAAFLARDLRVLTGVFLLLAVPVVLADLLRAVGVPLLTGSRRRAPETLERLSFSAGTTRLADLRATVAARPRLRLGSDTAPPVREAIRTGGPALLAWLFAGALLVTLQLGAVFDALSSWYPGLTLPRLPTLISWATIPDADYHAPTGRWVGGFLGLAPAASWALRLLVAEAYLLGILAWVWAGGRIVRVFLRGADEPLLGGAVLDVFRREWRVPVGLFIVCLVGAAALFAPATGPSMADDPTLEYSNQYVSYVEDGQVERVLRLGTVMPSQPDTSPEGTAGPLEYDSYDRFHPFGVVADLSARKMRGEVPFSRDLFTWWIMAVQSLLPYLAVLGGVTMVGALLLVAAGHLRRADGLFAVAADLLALLPLVPALVVLQEAVVEGQGGPSVSIPSPVPGGTGSGPPPAESLPIIAFGGLAAFLVGRSVRRHAARSETVRGRLRRAVGPAAGYAAMTTAGATVFVVVVRLFYRNRISTSTVGPTIPVFDPRAALNFTWIDTSIWYTHTVPTLATVGFLVGLALLGDGLRRATDANGDPEGDGATEPPAGGGGA
ncbi:MAG: hypothetical protein ABEJ35_03665 [Halobacteriaceae archaeon]